MNPLRSVGARLSLALAVVVAGALGAVYLFVVPPLEAQHGTVSRGDERYAEVAEPLDDTGYVLLLSAPLHDTLGSVHLVQHRLAIAGVAALLASLAVGFGGASLFARRIRRLERAADRIAGGRFDESVEDPTPDELGELARAFERMRLRLAHPHRARAEFIANA